MLLRYLFEQSLIPSMVALVVALEAAGVLRKYKGHME